MKKKLLSLILVLSLLLGNHMIAAADAESAVNLSELYKTRDTDSTWSAASAQTIDLSSAEEKTITISTAGDYVLSGSLNGQIVVNAPTEAKVRLILNGVEIVSPEGPAIYEVQADKLIITLAEGTQNSLTDGTVIQDGDDTIGAALYAEDDLSINGSGALSVNGTQKHGIQSKADLILAGGEIQVTAQMDGIRGRNSVLMLDGQIQVTAGGDGVTATRTDKEGKGWIVLAGGSLAVKTGEGAGEARASGKEAGWGRGGWSTSSSAGSDEVSQKAVKAATDLTILEGSYDFNCADDGLHADSIVIEGGALSIRSGDDGVHADSELTISGGEIHVLQSYEGLEGQNVTVSGGEIQITASDDGVNAAGGNDGSGFGGWGNDRFSASGGQLNVTGGELYVHAGGDALDSNGGVSLTGGSIGVWARTTTGEGAIDFNGTGTINGANLIVASTGGVMQDTANLTGQSVMALSVSAASGDEIRLQREDGETLMSFTLENSCDTILVSSAQLAEGSAFSLLTGEKVLYAGTMSGNLYSAGAFGQNGFGGMGGGRGGMGGPNEMSRGGGRGRGR